MIDFELLPATKQAAEMSHGLAEGLLRKVSRHYDIHEHEKIQELYDFMASMGGGTIKDATKKGSDEKAKTEPGLSGVVTIEEMSWGDLGILLAFPGRGLGNSAIDAVATPEQKKRFGHRFAAMAITEPNAGSDTASVSTTAVLDPETNEWVLNGEKIFVTSGAYADTVVVWATLDKRAGRAAIKSFVVEKDRPGITVSKIEQKLGIRASDTASVVLEDCRIPFDNVLGDPEIKERKAGLGGAMATFDATRPGVAAMGLGVARAALEFTKAKLEEAGYTFPYDKSPWELTAVQKTVLDMEAELEAARLLTYRAASMLDTGRRNSLEASMAKSKAGRMATLVTQKCVELLGPIGYSRLHLAEKWMRDSKITDIFEGTGQIQRLIVARQILGFNRDQLK